MTRPAILLDTHAFLWLLQAPERLSADAAAAIRGAQLVFVSTATVLEAGTKYRIGKLPVVAPLVAAGWAEVLEHAGATPLAVSLADAALAGAHASAHRDPWDRLIAAQAVLRTLPVVSNDAALDTFDVARIW
ncbi:PIN domain-containing protein [Gemmatimonadetes bacterium T265]|nr:PIN domain-containing protein [Gemmatimonadetes bacterium T265]